MNIYTFYYIKISWKSLFLESYQRTKLYILLFQIRETLDLAFGAGLQLTADIPRIGKYRMKWQGERIASSDYENESCKDTDEECAGRGGICKSIPKTDKAHNKMKKLNSEKVCGFNHGKEEDTEICACIGKAGHKCLTVTKGLKSFHLFQMKRNTCKTRKTSWMKVSFGF